VAIAVGKEFVGENAHEFNQTQGYAIPEILRRVMMKVFSGWFSSKRNIVFHRSGSFV
jgi:hypothetical protein